MKDTTDTNQTVYVGIYSGMYLVFSKIYLAMSFLQGSAVLHFFHLQCRLENLSLALAPSLCPVKLMQQSLHQLLRVLLLVIKLQHKLLSMAPVGNLKPQTHILTTLLVQLQHKLLYIVPVKVRHKCSLLPFEKYYPDKFLPHSTLSPHFSRQHQHQLNLILGKRSVC